MKIFQRNKEVKKVEKSKSIKGHFDGYNGSTLWGWACKSDSNTPVDLLLTVNDQEYLSFVANKFRQDLKDANIENGYVAFNESLDVQKIISKFGSSAVLKVIEKSSGKELSDSPKYLIEPKLKWCVDIYSDDTFAGWVVDINNEELQLKLNVYINDELAGVVTAGLNREDLGGIGIDNCHHGFHFNFSEFSKDKELFKVRIEIDYDEKYIIGDEREVFSFQARIQELTSLQAFLKENNYNSRSLKSDRLVKGILPGLIDSCRAYGAVPMSEINKIEFTEAKEEIAVIVPIYKGVDETLNCLTSVLKSKNKQAYCLIAINDCGPEAEMQPALQELARSNHFELYENEENLGFVGTVNRGMKLAVGHDVILLNSDTIVADGWLDAIKEVAISSPTIGTITPISNNATICSYPRFCLDNDLPKGYDVNQLARLCSDNVEDPIELPTAHGYCMFIKREVLNEVGYFDEQKWGKGYAEENDFSLRASKLGWKHVVTNKTFVQHLGSVSFAEDTEGFIATNLEKLNGMYPDYPLLVERFIRKDPVRNLRKELGKKLLLKELDSASATLPAKGKSMLFVSLTIGGGTKVATDDLARLLNQEGQSVFMLTTKNNKVWELSSHISNAIVEFDIEHEYQEFIDFLKALDVWHVHYHHVLEFGKSIWNIPQDLGCEYDVTLHDYYSVCPRVNFLTVNDEFCGEPDINGCRACLKAVGVHESSFLKLEDVGNDIATWRSYFYENLEGARKVITPSKDTKSRIEKYFQLKNVEALYHPENVEVIQFINEPKNKGEVINIGFIGAIGPHKGLKVVKDLAEEVSLSNKNIKITIVGYTSDDDYFKQYDFVTITGPYNKPELEDLMAVEKIDVIFLASIWPETFGYTYSEALRLGYPIVSFNHGAIVERSIDNENCILLDNDIKPEKVLGIICEFIRSAPLKLKVKCGKSYPSIIKSYYEVL